MFERLCDKKYSSGIKTYIRRSHCIIDYILMNDKFDHLMRNILVYNGRDAHPTDYFLVI
jgi:hypothetical protein